MATIQANAQLTDNHEPDDFLQLRVGSGDRLTLAESTPAGGIVLIEEPIGEAANVDPPPTRTLKASHTPPGNERAAVLAIGITVKDKAGNVSTLFETFEEVADYPRGVTTLPVEATANPNEATLSWTASPQVEGAAS